MGRYEYADIIILIAIVEGDTGKYHKFIAVYCECEARAANNAKGNERVIFLKYRRSIMAIRYFIVYLRSLFCTGAVVARASNVRKDCS